MRYITNADDFGRTKTVNEAIVYGFDHGYLSRTTIMVNAPFFEEAVELSRQHGFYDRVGLHINLTAGAPLTESIKACHRFCNKNGYFTGQLFHDKKLMLWASGKEKEAIKEEVTAQIERYREAGFVLKHADSHGHVHTFLSVASAIMTTLREYGFETIRLAANVEVSGWKRIYKRRINRHINRYCENRAVEYKYFDSLKEIRKNMNRLDTEAGLCEIMVHPNIYDNDLQIGDGMHYSDLAAFVSKG